MTTALSTDLAIVEFARRWHRLGGGSAEEISFRFDLDVPQFCSRVLELLGSAELSADESARIQRVYRARLWSLKA